jgi:hypothetical protein
MNYLLFPKVNTMKSEVAKKFFCLMALCGMVVSGFSSFTGPRVAYAEDTTVFSEDFESVGTPSLPAGWVSTGSNWGTYDTGEAPYGKVLYGDFQNFPYTADEDTTATSPTINLSGAASAKVNFTARCDSEYSDPAAISDHMSLEVSGDGGTNFTELLRWNESTLDSDTNEDGPAVKEFTNISIPSFYLTSNAKLRFQWVTNSDDNAYDGCYVDQISVVKSSNGGGGDTTAPMITGLSNDTTPTASKTWNWSSDDASAQYRYVIDQSGVGVPTGSYGSVTTATQSSGNGTYYLHVQARDTAGNESSVATVSAILSNDTGGGNDTTAPIVSFTSPTPANGSGVSGNNFTVSLSSSDSEGLHYSLVNFDNDLKFWLSDLNNGNPQDRSGNNASITVHNEASAVAGHYGGAISFDGSDDFLSVNASYGNLTNFTDSVWINPDAQNPDGVFLRMGDHAIQVANDTTLRYWDGSNSFDAENAISANGWSHIVAVGENGELKLYVNDILKGVFDMTSPQGPVQYIGQYWNDPENQTGFYKGLVDEVLVFGRALSQDEIVSLGTATAHQYSHNFTSLINGSHTVKGFAIDDAGNIGMTELRTITTGTTTGGGTPSTISFDTVVTNPLSGTFGAGQSFNAYFYETHGETDLEINNVCRINNVDVGSSFYNAGGGHYGVTYTVGANDTNRAAGQVPVFCMFRDTSSGATTTVSAFTSSNVAVQITTGGGTGTGTGTTTGTIGGTVTGGDAALSVTSIEQVRSTAVANGNFEDGWKWIFHVTVPNNETSVSLKFNNWSGPSDASIAIANNVRVSSSQATSSGAIMITGANSYSSPLLVNGDADANAPGRQVDVTVEARIPSGSVNGAYTTSYGVRSLPQ